MDRFVRWDIWNFSCFLAFKQSCTVDEKNRRYVKISSTSIWRKDLIILGRSESSSRVTFPTFIHLSRNCNIPSFQKLSDFSARNFSTWSFTSTKFPKIATNLPRNSITFYFNALIRFNRNKEKNKQSKGAEIFLLLHERTKFLKIVVTKWDDAPTTYNAVLCESLRFFRFFFFRRKGSSNEFPCRFRFFSTQRAAFRVH